MPSTVLVTELPTTRRPKPEAPVVGRVTENHDEAATLALADRQPFPDELRGKYQAFTCADLSLLHGAGFEQPSTSLADGVARYVAVLRETGGFYRLPPS